MSNRAKKGSVTVVVMAGRLKIRLPRSWFGGEQHYLSLELPDTEANHKYADRLAADIALDYIKGEFDWTLNKYRSPSIVPAAEQKDLTLSQLWGKYCEYKDYRWKELTKLYFVSTLGRHIYKCPHQSIDDALMIRTWLLSETTPDMARRTIAALETVVTWGRKYGLVNVDNRFMGMAEDIPLHRKQLQPNAFSPEEQSAIIEAFKRHRRYSYYSDLVLFWFLTGCRPSEGIGLEWLQIDEDGRSICFDRSRVIDGKGKEILNSLSKTNRSRMFPINEKLGELIANLQRRKAAPSICLTGLTEDQQKAYNKLQRRKKSPLVFPSKEGYTINYQKFAAEAWKVVVTPIVGRPSTPYSCRDTFITRQLANKISIEWVAKWVDNSPEIIRARYLDISAADDIFPV
jgi:integrase